MKDAARLASPATAALIGFLGLASAMGVGRFAFTPMLPLMQQAGTLSLAQGGTLARANYLMAGIQEARRLGLGALFLGRAPAPAIPPSPLPGERP